MQICNSSIKTMLAAVLSALGTFGVSGNSLAQADGPAVVPVAVAPTPAPKVFQPAGGGGPGAGLMNNLHARMKEIQATPDPVLRQRRMDEFLKTLKDGMSSISKQPVAAAKR